MKTLFSAIFGKLLHFIIDGREPKLFDFKSSSQQQCCKAHKIGQLYHQDQASTFQLALKWQKGANGGFCKFGPFQPYLTHRQLDWSSMMFIESHFYGYPTCLVFAHVVWWLRALWTARTTRRTRPGSLLTWGCITSVEIFFNKDVMCCGDGGWDKSFFILSTCLTTPSTCEMVVNDTVDCKNNLEEITREVADNRMYHFGKNFLQLRLDMLWWWWFKWELFTFLTLLAT